MIATASDRGVAAYNAITGKLDTREPRSGDHLHVPDDGESVAGWTSQTTFWPCELRHVAQVASAQLICRKLGLKLGGSPLTSRAVFQYLNPNH